jgi:hypothetical protein
MTSCTSTDACSSPRAPSRVPPPRARSMSSTRWRWVWRARAERRTRR